MTDAKISYVGPIPDLIAGPPPSKRWWKRIPLAFLLLVVAPTTIAAIYFLLIASPRYVSESRFIVRAAHQAQPSTLGIALQGVGLSNTTSDAFAIHEYISSPDGMREAEKKFDLSKVLSPRGLDVFTGWPRLGEGRSDESRYKGFERFVTIGYDAATGISVLRVEAFDPETAYRLNRTLLEGGEGLVNRLNVRQAEDAVQDARLSVQEARERLAEIQGQLTAFRNQERFVDPARTAAEGSQLIGSLMTTLATLRAERSQLAQEAPQSPQLASLDNRIAAYQRQIDAEREKIAGSSTSLASKIGSYEELVASRELADKELAQATASLISAAQEARRQKLYLERIVEPNIPDKATSPRRLLSILTVLVSMLLAYSVGWLVWAGVREHRQH
ncbi:chain-length determining protein [Brevundimonas aurantiaca]|uniref:chain-length determining protein n=1 Tax=Brevundimonas aurantiaca TaxID=74316 RepID=UPI00174B8EB3|nr:chain-length determining protein [Brevundimonas aurantiaca]